MPDMSMLQGQWAQIGAVGILLYAVYRFFNLIEVHGMEWLKRLVVSVEQIPGAMNVVNTVMVNNHKEVMGAIEEVRVRVDKVENGSLFKRKVN